MKEWLRKQLVSLKRNPYYIPLFLMIISCLVFNLNLTAYSKTILLVNADGMGLCSFAITLCSFLSLITYLSAYPKRKKPAYAKIIITAVMIVLSIVCQVLFYYFIYEALYLRENPIPMNKDRAYVFEAQNNSIIHIIFLIITLIAMATLPLYKKLLLKINTSIKIEENNVDNVVVEKEIE